MAERVIKPTSGIEMFVNENNSISLVQRNWHDLYDSDQIVVIELRDVETVRQWLAELYLEAMAEE